MQIADKQGELVDLPDFFYRRWLQIVVMGMLGIAVSGVYVVMTPKTYEAKWQMSMAQMVAGSSNIGANININSEEPAALIQRLRSPLIYTPSVLEACGKSSNETMGEYLDNTLQMQIVKNLPNVAGFRLRMGSPELAKSCADAIVAMVIEQQSSIIHERQEGKKEQVAQYQKLLRDEMWQLDQLKNTQLGNFGYLAMLDKLTWLRGRIDGLQEELFLSQKYPSKLLSPIDVSRNPVSPNVNLVLILGLLLGLITGLLYAISREGWFKVKFRA
jgi:uncharacterized protein involved in exopolysaccharide biosynthesis